MSPCPHPHDSAQAESLDSIGVQLSDDDAVELYTCACGSTFGVPRPVAEYRRCVKCRAVDHVDGGTEYADGWRCRGCARGLHRCEGCERGRRHVDDDGFCRSCRRDGEEYRETVTAAWGAR